MAEADRVYLYRKFECDIIDKQVEAAIFKSMSDSGQGPKLIFQNSEYRIECFFQGRPLTIWELRNPVIVESYVKAIYGMHTKSGVSEAIEAIKPRATTKMGVEIAIEDWGPAVISKIAALRQKLNPEDEGHRSILTSLDCVSETFLKDGYQEVLRACIPSGTVLMCHNDAQENNILSSIEDTTKIILIDYEYGMWNPQMYDLGNYLNEFCLDNAYPLGTGVAYALSNWPTEEEIVKITRLYYQLTKADTDHSNFSVDDPEFFQKVKEVKQCMLLSNFYWGVWAIMLLLEADETNPNAFNWEFARGRTDLYKLCVRDFGFGNI